MYFTLNLKKLYVRYFEMLLERKNHCLIYIYRERERVMSIISYTNVVMFRQVFLKHF